MSGYPGYQTPIAYEYINPEWHMQALEAGIQPFAGQQIQVQYNNDQLAQQLEQQAIDEENIATPIVQFDPNFDEPNHAQSFAQDLTQRLEILKKEREKDLEAFNTTNIFLRW